MKIQNYLLVVALFVVTASCQTGKTLENVFTYSTVNVDESNSFLNNPDNPKYELNLSFTYPATCKDEEVLGKIQKLFLSTFFNETYENYTPEEAMAHYVEGKHHDYKALEDEFKQKIKKSKKASLLGFARYETVSNKVIFDKKDLLSFSVYKENYAGGAHPTHSVTNYVIDVQRGAFLTEDELFVKDFKDKLAQILVKNIAAQNKLDNPKRLEEIGFFDITKIAPNGNFLIDDDGLTYSFNEYEIAAYSVGVVNVHVSYAEIKGLLRKGSPIRHVENS
jgi:hypothetical protein